MVGITPSLFHETYQVGYRRRVFLGGVDYAAQEANRSGGSLICSGRRIHKRSAEIPSFLLGFLLNTRQWLTEPVFRARPVSSDRQYESRGFVRFTATDSSGSYSASTPAELVRAGISRRCV